MPSSSAEAVSDSGICLSEEMPSHEMFEFNGKEDGPTSVILVGVHGNETCGVEALKKILPSLQIERGRVFIGYGNPHAIQQNVRSTEANLNRMFKPDDMLSESEKASYEYERAQFLKKYLEQGDALLDVHSSNIPQSRPFIICEPNASEITECLPFDLVVFGFDAVAGDVSEHLRVGFIEVYREAFGGHPYFETYTDEQVLNDTWFPHVATGIIVLALDGEQVIGLGCAQPVSGSLPEDQVFLKARQKDGSLLGSTDTMWYMSEMAVLTHYRRRGIGYQLVRERLKRILTLGGDRYFFRTAAESSNSAPLYLNIGAIQLPGKISVSDKAQVLINQSQSHERIFFYGSCVEAISMIEMIAQDT